MTIATGSVVWADEGTTAAGAGGANSAEWPQARSASANAGRMRLEHLKAIPEREREGPQRSGDDAAEGRVGEETEPAFGERHAAPHRPLDAGGDLGAEERGRVVDGRLPRHGKVAPHMRHRGARAEEQARPDARIEAGADRGCEGEEVRSRAGRDRLRAREGGVLLRKPVREVAREEDLRSEAIAADRHFQANRRRGEIVQVADRADLGADRQRGKLGEERNPGVRAGGAGGDGDERVAVQPGSGRYVDGLVLSRADGDDALHRSAVRGGARGQRGNGVAVLIGDGEMDPRGADSVGADGTGVASAG